MFTLTDAEVEALSKSTDPVIAASALKLKKAEEDGEFIPKSRLAEVTKARKDLETRLAAFEAEQRKKEEDKARAAGELDKLLEAEKKARTDAETKLAEETKLADAYRAHHKTAVEAVKKQLGDKWLPEFETFSLDSLYKLPGVDAQKLGVTTTAPALPADKYFTREQIEAIPQSEMTGDVLKKVNDSLAHLGSQQK
jgi:hypothetical protein